MSVTIGTSGFMRGVGNKLPELPKGWAAIEREGCWVLAISPDDKLFYLTQDKVYPLLPAIGTYPHRKARVDDRNPILISSL